MSAAELAALLLAEAGPVSDPQELAEWLLGPARVVPRVAIGGPASVSSRRGRPVLLVASDVPLVDVHRACAFLVVRAWLRRAVGADEAEAAAGLVAAEVVARRPPDSAVVLRVCAR